MSTIENSVFISYRRTNIAWALAIHQNLTVHGYDVFFDFESIDSGSFESVILNNVASRAHFIVILTPSALERCNEPGDWLRREIEYALEHRRNIVPLMLEGFDFGSPAINQYLTGKLAALKDYNALRVPADFFSEAMTRLRDRYLNTPLEAVLHPRSVEATDAAQQQQEVIQQAQPVPEVTLSAIEWFERGLQDFKAGELDEAVRCYTEAIRLAPDYAFAYNNRGTVYSRQGRTEDAIRDFTHSLELDNLEDYLPHNNRGLAYYAQAQYAEALADFNAAIRINPDYAEAYNNRGGVYHTLERYAEAIADFEATLRLEPDHVRAWYNRGFARYKMGQYTEALSDYTQAISLDPTYAPAWLNRGLVYQDMGQIDDALQDYTTAIRLQPEMSAAFINRGVAYASQGDLDSAIADFETAVRLNPEDAVARENLAILKQHRDSQG